MTDLAYTYSPEKIMLTRKDIETISQIIRDNELDVFEIYQDGSNGIGRVTFMEFELNLHGRYVTVRANINDQSDW